MLEHMIHNKTHMSVGREGVWGIKRIKNLAFWYLGWRTSTYHSALQNANATDLQNASWLALSVTLSKVSNVSFLQNVHIYIMGLTFLVKIGQRHQKYQQYQQYHKYQIHQGSECTKNSAVKSTTGVQTHVASNRARCSAIRFRETKLRAQNARP